MPTELHGSDWISNELGRNSRPAIDSIGNHTWKVVRGTGDYARLVGHGRGAVVGFRTDV